MELMELLGKTSRHACERYERVIRGANKESARISIGKEVREYWEENSWIFREIPKGFLGKIDDAMKAFLSFNTREWTEQGIELLVEKETSSLRNCHHEDLWKQATLTGYILQGDKEIAQESGVKPAEFLPPFNPCGLEADPDNAFAKEYKKMKGKDEEHLLEKWARALLEINRRIIEG